ncbi:MAG: gamma-glutamyltransferase [Rhodospirillaceae bacterium]|jgi:gamma-glutamyltranspeptidase/glutathione hydrolase
MTISHNHRRLFRRIGLIACIPVALLIAACETADTDGPASTPGDGVTSSPAETTNPDNSNATPKAAPDEPIPESVVPDIPPAKAPAKSKRHMVSAAHPLAAKVGRDILRKGGSAVDAAIAIQMMLTLVEPQSSGIGGGGFMISFHAKTGDIVTYDGRETAPASAHPYMFLDGTGKAKPYRDATVGGIPVGVPGLVHMLEQAHKKYGRLPWRSLFKPAIEQARKGYPVSERLNKMVARDFRLKTFHAAFDYFYTSSGTPKPVGTMLVNKPLADVLEAIAKQGSKALYTGPIAQDIVDTVNNAYRNPGRMKLSDLAKYKSIKREPVCLAYRVNFICGMGPPSSGGITLLQILGILQNFDMANMAPASSQAVHVIAEATRLAYADRNTFIADPAFIPVPIAGMLDPGYLKLRAQDIKQYESLEKPLPGMPGITTGKALQPDPAPHGVSTTHFSVIDQDGNAVAVTSSLQNPFGSRLMVRGFLLNSQLTDFSFIPNKDRAPLPNRAAPHKRPLSSMAPTLVFDGQGQVVMAVGSPGGSRIIGYVAKTLIATLDWKMDIQAAISLPNFTNRLRGTELERGSALSAIAPALKELGHNVRMRRMTSGLHGILRTKDGFTGGADPRREGVSLGD